VRELKNVIERAVVLSTGPWIQEPDLLLSSLSTTGETSIRRVVDDLTASPDSFVPISLEEIEKEHINRTLTHVQWNKSLASKYLGIERTTLDRKIKRYALEKDD
jgi:Nif-specific regulatory protein